MTILYYIIMFILDAHAGAEMCQANILSSFSCLLVRFGACVFFIFSPAPPIATSPAAACPYAPAKQQKRVNLQESTTWSALRQKGISMDFKWFPPLLRCCWLAEHWNQSPNCTRNDSTACVASASLSFSASSCHCTFSSCSASRCSCHSMVQTWHKQAVHVAVQTGSNRHVRHVNLTAKKHHRCHRHLGSHPVDKVWCFWCLCLLQLFFQLKLQRSGLHVPLFLSQTWADLSPQICDSTLCSIWLWSLNCYKCIVLMSKPCNSTLQRWNHI